MTKETPIKTKIVYEDKRGHAVFEVEHSLRYNEASYISDYGLELMSLGARPLTAKELLLLRTRAKPENSFRKWCTFTSEGVIYVPERNAVILARNSPILQDSESFETTISRARAWESLETYFNEFYLDFHPFMKRARSDAAKKPWQRDLMYIGDLACHALEEKAGLHMDTERLGEYEEALFLFGKDAKDFGSKIRDKGIEQIVISFFGDYGRELKEHGKEKEQGPFGPQKEAFARQLMIYGCGKNLETQRVQTGQIMCGLVHFALTFGLNKEKTQKLLRKFRAKKNKEYKKQDEEQLREDFSSRPSLIQKLGDCFPEDLTVEDLEQASDRFYGMIEGSKDEKSYHISKGNEIDMDTARESCRFLMEFSAQELKWIEDLAGKLGYGGFHPGIYDGIYRRYNDVPGNCVGVVKTVLIDLPSHNNTFGRYDIENMGRVTRTVAKVKKIFDKEIKKRLKDDK